jgi:Flp pilus assembly protein CpaB
MAITRTDAVAVFGGLAVGVLLGWIRLPAPPPHEKVSVLVAKEQITQGTKITEPEERFEAREFNKGEEPQGAFARFEDVKDKRVIRTLPPGTLITAADLMAPEPVWDWPRGHRAVSIKVANHKEELARLREKARVDVLLARPTEDGGTKYETVVPDLLVVDVQLPGHRGAGGEIVPDACVILATPTEQIIRLARAQQEGECWVRPVVLGE